jgi:hypothetical protein
MLALLLTFNQVAIIYGEKFRRPTMKRIVAPVVFVTLMLTSLAMMLAPAAEAQSETIIFTASMAATNEVAPVVVHPTELGANGTSTVTLRVTRSGGVITAASSDFTWNVAGFPISPVSQMILAHIHQGAAGVNGPIVVDSGLNPTVPIPITGGVASVTRTNLATTNAIAQAIIDNPAGFYFNVHTALSPGGALRGQLVRQQQGQPTLGAPTLSQWGAILMTLLFIAAATFFLLGRARATAIAGVESSNAATEPASAIDWKLLAKVAIAVEVIIGVTLLALSANAVDTIGALTSGLVVAFILHLFIGNARRR